MTSTEHTTTAANVRAGDVITWVAPASPTSWAMDDVRDFVVTSATDDSENPGRVLIRGEGGSLLRLTPDRAVRVRREDEPAAGALSPRKVADMPVGAYVIVPTSHSGTHTGVLIARRGLGPHAAAGDFMATIQYDDGTQQEVRTNDAYSGWVEGGHAEQVVTVPAVALRPGHVIVDSDGTRHLVEHVRVHGTVYLLDTRPAAGGPEERGLPMGPDAVVNIAVVVPA